MERICQKDLALPLQLDKEEAEISDDFFDQLELYQSGLSF